MSEIKVRLVTNWCENDHLRDVWNRMTPRGDYKWNRITVLAETDPAEEDYFVVVNHPKPGDRVVPSKTILLFMEPDAFRAGAPTEWIERPLHNLFHIFGYGNGGRNNVEWHLSKTYAQLSTETIVKSKSLSAIISGQQYYPGHKLRYRFLEHLDSVPDFDLYGKDPLPFRSYRGPLPPNTKDAGLFPYRYTFNAENNAEPGYFTEKIVDAILAECLCFYWGCPNLEDYIDPRAFIRVDLEDPARALQQIRDAIDTDEWGKRIDVIRREKHRILNELQFFPTLEGIIDERRRLAETVNSKVDIQCINLARSPDRWRESVDEFRRFGLDVTRYEALDGGTLDPNDLIARGIIHPDARIRYQAGVLGLIATSVELWKRIALQEQDRWTLILEDDVRFHPRFLELFEDYWRDIPEDAEMVYWGCHHPLSTDTPFRNDIILDLGVPVTDRILRLHHIVQGTVAYMIKPSTARRFLNELLPLRKPLDCFPPDRFRIYTFRRPGGTDEEMIRDFYTDTSMYEGERSTIVHGVVSMRPTTSTIGQKCYHRWANAQYRMNIKDYATALAHFTQIAEAKCNCDSMMHNFDVFDAIGNVAYHAERRDLGVRAFDKLLTHAEEGVRETLDGLQNHGERISTNLKFYDRADLSERLTRLLRRKRRIGFHEDQLCERGSSIALYDYAHHNEKLLGNTSIIFYQRDHPVNHPAVVDRFRSRFQCYGYTRFEEVEQIVRREGIEAVYFLKFGWQDGRELKSCKNLVHSIFGNQPHGHVYAFVSRWMSETYARNVPYVPHMIDLPSASGGGEAGSLRSKLGIPEDAVVLGRYGGRDSFDLEFVHRVVERAVEEDPRMYFLFANTDRFMGEHPRVIHLDTLVDRGDKVRFIMACDAMLHARKRGETFGLAIGEFSTLNKPILTYGLSVEGSHYQILRDKGLYYKDGDELLQFLREIRTLVRRHQDWNCYREFTPWKVMTRFADVFLRGLTPGPSLQSTEPEDSYTVVVNSPDERQAGKISLEDCIFLRTRDRVDIGDPVWDDPDPFAFLSIRDLDAGDDPVTVACDLVASRNERIAYVNSSLKIYCVNLKRSTQRWEGSVREFARHGLTVERVEAVDGVGAGDGAGDFDDLLRKGIVHRDLSPLARESGPLGLIATSVQLWRRIAEADDRWSLILGDDVRFHPQFLDLFHSHWRTVPDDADIVYLGFTHTVGQDPYSQDVLTAISTPVNEMIVRLRAPRIGMIGRTFAYALTPRTARRLLEDCLPLTMAIDHLPPEKFTTYAFRRPEPTPRLVCDSMYIDTQVTDGLGSAILFGVIGCRSEKSLMERARQRRSQRDYVNAYRYLCHLFTSEVERIHDFDLLDELGIVAYHVGEKDIGRRALLRMADLCEGRVSPVVDGLRAHGERILKNAGFYGLSLYERLEKVLRDLPVTDPEAHRRRRIDFLHSKLDVYCINLERCKERWTRSVEEFARHGLRVTRFEAVDATRLGLTFEELLRRRIVTEALPEMTRRQRADLGIIATSVELWRQIAGTRDRDSGPGPGKWTLILEDDVALHPDFLELFERYWPTIPADAEIVFLGLNWSAGQDPYDPEGLAPISSPVNEGIVRLLYKVAGNFAYALAPRTAERLLREYVPLSASLDNIPVDRFRQYAFKRPAHTDRALIDRMYIETAFSGGTSCAILYGLIGCRSEVSTFDRKVGVTFDLARDARGGRDYQTAYQHLEKLLVDPTSDVIYSFQLWDEVISVVYYVGRREVGVDAVDRVLRLVEQRNPETISGLRDHGARLLHNFRFYGDHVRYDRLKRVVDGLTAPATAPATAPQSPNDLFDIHCINLERCKERWTRSVEEFTRHGLRVTRFEAFDGEDVDPEDLIREGILHPDADCLHHGGAIGIIASSVALWSQIAVRGEEDDRWVLILEDDVRFHPEFKDLLPLYWSQVPDDADIVLLGFQYPWQCDPYDESVLSNISVPVPVPVPGADMVVHLHTTVNGNHAYAIRPRTARRLLTEYLPLRRAVDKFPTDRYNVYAFRRPPGTGRALIKEMYLDDTMWEGHYPISQYGLIGTRGESSTINHAHTQYISLAQRARREGKYEEAYGYLTKIRQNPELHDPFVMNFTLWHEMIVVAYYVDRAEGLNAFEELIRRSGTPEARAGLREHGDHILGCMTYYRGDLERRLNDVVSSVNGASPVGEKCLPSIV